jgi:type I restriction enzyme, R subunit
MNSIGKPERETQNRVVALFTETLGYRYGGNRSDTENSNIDEPLLTAHLEQSGYTPAQIGRAIDLLHKSTSNVNRSLYDVNQGVYSLIRYGIPVKTEAGEATTTVHVIDWKHPERNDFLIAEEVTLRSGGGGLERRPDVVLYVNGIAVAVIELKNSRTSVGDGIRQLLSNQQDQFNAWFFSTVQIVFAGNDSEGLRYGTIKTEEKYFLKWKEDEQDDAGYKLDKYLQAMCRKERLIELMHDFVVFDGGVKKLPRVHQYFGVKAAQRYVNDYKGGIIWHTQGSGKSIVMVLLAKWILENKPNARVLILTDRDELDKQIEQVFASGGESVYRTSSGSDLLSNLNKPAPRLLCSLVHKFGRRDVDDFDAFIDGLKAQPSAVVGELFVFVDECHRTQSGKLHKTMKAMLPSAVFIGFTGTPLLKKDKQTSLEVFGGYIHTYKFNEAVQDEVVLDLVYEARDIEQSLGSQDKVDAWFDAKTRGLNSWQKAALREQWGTMQVVLSSRSRMERVVSDIVFDFSVKPRLSDQRGNAMLVASSIYEACRYFELFQKTVFKGKCAVVTSYNPQAKDITQEETGANTETDKQFIYNLYTDLLKTAGDKSTEFYEDRIKELFKKQPANMKLLIVVDKLLTGFDAPPCTYLYLDKKMQDHGLFQAICRTNRLDGEDKTFGYVVDYKDLFQRVENTISVYTSPLDDSAEGGSAEVMLYDRLQTGSERLDRAVEHLALLCDPVQPPKSDLDHIHYFCGNVDIPDDLTTHEPQRVALYKAVAVLVRAYANIADDLPQAGYTPAQIANIKQSIDHYLKLRDVIRKASGEVIDLKAYEPDMRHLIDTYIEADASRKISAFGEIGLLEIILNRGISEAVANLPEGIKGDTAAVAETIANNIRSKIIKEHLNDPAFYDRMSALLKEILADLKAQRVSYEEFLRRIADVATQTQTGADTDLPEPLKKNAALRAIYNLLEKDKPPVDRDRVAEARSSYNNFVYGSPLHTATLIDNAIRANRPDGWRGTLAKEREVKRIIHEIVKDSVQVEKLFLIVRAQRDY